MEKKILALVDVKASDAGSGSFTGYGSLFGIKDSQGDIVQPGAYVDTLPEFIQRGFIGWSHDWENPVATISDAHEDEKGLFIAAEFHSDPESQKARTRTMERLARGKFMGLSIGYETQDAEFTDQARLLKRIKLFEVSLVTVPALDPAGVTAAKSGKHYGSDAPEGSYEALAQDVADAYQIVRGAGYTIIPVATFADHSILCAWANPNGGMLADLSETYWSVPYSRNADGTLVLGTATQVEEQVSYAPAKERALAVLGLKAAIRSHSTETTNAGWDSGMAWRHCPADAAALKAACAWMDPNGDANVKSTYKFIHHMVTADGTVGAANLTACSTAIGVLNGGRGGTTIPDADVAGVHAHLAKHLTDAGNDAPPLKTIEPEGVKEGRRNAASDQSRIQQLHDLASELGAACGAADEPAKSDAPTVAKDEEPLEAKSKESRGLTTLAALIAIELLELGTG